MVVLGLFLCKGLLKTATTRQPPAVSTKRSGDSTRIKLAKRTIQTKKKARAIQAR